MGTIIETDATVDYSGEIVTPVIQALGFYEPGGDAASSLRNLARPALPALLTSGAFTGGAGYMTLGGNAIDARIDTQIGEPDAMTIFCVSRQASSGDVRVVSDYNTNSGVAVRYSSGNRLFFLIGDGSGAGTSYSGYAALPDAGWVLWCLTVPKAGEGLARLTDLTRGSPVTISISSAARAKSSSTFRLGANPTPTVGGTVDVALTAIYDRVLTDAEIAEVAAFIRAEMAITLPGVTV